MKKNGKAIALGLAGVMLFSGCGAADGESPAATSEAEAYITEKPAEQMEEGTAGMPEPAEETDSWESAADETARTEGALEESCETPMADLHAKKSATDGYLGFCYDFPDTDIDCAETSEEYSKWEEKGFLSVMAEPLSTFSADVDTASYSNLRRLIREGYDLESLPEGAVRIEELLNYFSYDYAEPLGNEPFGVTTQIGSCPWNAEAELVMIGLKTEDIDYSHAPASNLVFLLDVSGSMDEADKLPLLQESFMQLAENLTRKDRISIVTYASEDRVVLEGARGDQKEKIKKALDSLEAGGGTYGSRGIETAYELAEENFIKGGNNRIILATDGDLNIGMTSEEELEELISEKKESGIFLSVLGFGTGNIKDNKMEILADKGNGNYAYIDCMQEAKKVLSEEMTATLLTVCKDVKFQVEFNPDVVECYRLLGYDNRALERQDFDDDTKDGGEIGAGHSVTALYEIILCDPLEHVLTEEEIRGLKYRDAFQKKRDDTISSVSGQEWMTISVRYKRPSENRSELLEYPIGYERYYKRPSDDFAFAAAVAEFGLLASHSEYPENASVESVKKTIRNLDLNDSYKMEFLELVEEAE